MKRSNKEILEEIQELLSELDADHVVMDASKEPVVHRCRRCGATKEPLKNVPIMEFVHDGNAFLMTHANCILREH